jgi:hypothetical protein
MRVAVPGLPEPTGPYPAGTTSVWLRDTARPDPWVAEAGARELMVSLWYPAASLLADQLGFDIDAGTSGARSLDITRAYVRAFFDLHLRGQPQALLDQPSPRYPEVTFCSPARG